MSVVCDFNIQIRAIAADGETILGEFNDEAAGLSIVKGIDKPRHPTEWDRYTSPRAIGDFTSGAPQPTADDLIFGVLVTGSSWAEVESRWDAVAGPVYSASPGWVNTEWHYFVELVEDGVTTRWRTDIPVLSPRSYDRRNNRTVHEVRFHVQPNPSITVA